MRLCKLRDDTKRQTEVKVTAYLHVRRLRISGCVSPLHDMPSLCTQG